MNTNNIRIAGCLRGVLLGSASCRDTAPMNDARDENEVADSTADDMTVNDQDVLEDGGDTTWDGRGGCDQHVPTITSLVMEYCSTRFSGTCLFTGCDDCQVCYVDVSCGMPSPCGCYGTGRCYSMCSSNADCSENEECTNLGWYGGLDVMCAYKTKVCWPDDDPSTPTVCP